MSRENTGGRRITGSGTGAMRQMTLGAAVLVVIQIALAMVVNLYVRVPTDHPGSHPANFFSGSFHSVLWALGQGDVALVIHAWLGLALVALTFVVAVHAASLGPRSVSVRCLLGSLLAVGAGFNGAKLPGFRGSEHQLVDHGPARARSSVLLPTRAVSPSGSVTPANRAEPGPSVTNREAGRPLPEVAT